MTAGKVTRLPVRNRSLIAGVLSRAELESGPVDAIRQMGPLCATGTLAEKLDRVEAIVHALSGPGRVYLVDGVEVAIALLKDILISASAEAMRTVPTGSARQVTP